MTVEKVFRVQLGTDDRLYTNFNEHQQVWDQSDKWKQDLQGLANAYGNFDYIDDRGEHTGSYTKKTVTDPITPKR